MKKYKRKKIRYWFDSFERLNPFDIISVEEMISLYDDVYTKIENFNGDDKMNFVRNSDSDVVYYIVNYLPKADIEYPPADKYYWNLRNPVNYSLTEREGDVHRDGHSTQLVADHQFKTVRTDKVLYLELPQDLILDNMTTNQNADLMNLASYEGGTLYDRYNFRKVKAFIDEVESSKYSWKATNFIPIMDKYDKMYPELVKYDGLASKAPVFYKWRHAFILHQYISQKDYGLVFPVLCNSNDQLFFDGSHRVAQIALSKNDLPFFIKMSPEMLEQSYLTFIIPPYFDEEVILVEVDLENKKVLYSKISKEIYTTRIYKGRVSTVPKRGTLLFEKIHSLLPDRWNTDDYLNSMKAMSSPAHKVVYDEIINKKIIGEYSL